MSRREANFQDANLPPAPSPPDFVSQLRKWQEIENAKKGQPVAVDPIHGTTFTRNEPQKKRGTRGTEMAGVMCALQFQDILDETQVTYPTLDAWMVSWGRMTIAPEHLCEAPEDIAESMENRKRKCGVKFRYYSMVVSSFVTYVNAVCRVIRSGPVRSTHTFQ